MGAIFLTCCRSVIVLCTLSIRGNGQCWNYRQTVGNAFTHEFAPRYFTFVRTRHGLLAEEGVRLPGVRRAAIADAAAREDVEIPAALMADLKRFAV